MWSPSLNGGATLYRGGSKPVRISILPSGEYLPLDMDGEIQLFPQASAVFGQLAQNNEFTGECNVFRDIQVRRMHITSDRRRKADVQPIDPADATKVVRGVPAYTYTVDGQAAAGLMADDAPAECVRMRTRGGDGDGGGAAHLTLDYNAMLAYLWASLQDAHARLDAQERNAGRKKRKGRPL